MLQLEELAAKVGNARFCLEAHFESVNCALLVLLEGCYGVLDSYLRRKQSKSLEGLNFEYGGGVSWRKYGCDEKKKQISIRVDIKERG